MKIFQIFTKKDGAIGSILVAGSEIEVKKVLQVSNAGHHVATFGGRDLVGYKTHYPQTIGDMKKLQKEAEKIYDKTTDIERLSEAG